MTQAPPKQLNQGQPWWPAVVAVLAVCGLYLSLPESLTFGPSWLLLVVVFVLMVPAVIAKMRVLEFDQCRHGVVQRILRFAT